MNSKLVNTEIEKNLAEISRMNQETRKLVFESSKLFAEQKLLSKKVTWFEYTMILTSSVALIAFTKLFL